MDIQNPYIDNDKERVLNAMVSPTPEKDYTKYSGKTGGSIFDTIFRRRQPSPLYPIFGNPKDTSNLVEDWHVIGDQGYTGSCVGWGSGNGAIQYMMTKKGTLKENEWLSPKAAWISARVRDEWAENNDTYFALEGTSVKSSLEFFRTTGGMLDSWMPNWGDALMGANEALPFMAKYKISAYFNLGADQYEWRKWLSAGNPLVVTMQVDAPFYGANSDTGTLDLFNARQEGLHGLHCVSLFGHKRNANNGNDFLVRNSWGTYWGNKGFLNVSDNYAARSFLEVWGVVI